MNENDDFQLKNGSRIGVVGGGPAGSLFSYFLLELAKLIDLELTVDLYEPKDYSNQGPKGCNGCAGIISESLVQNLAVEGIDLPDDVVQRGIESYVVHTRESRVEIETPAGEQRIAAVHRGSGPLGTAVDGLKSFDGYLINNAIGAGANHLTSKVSGVTEIDSMPVIQVDGEDRKYDMVAVCIGVNSPLIKKISEEFQDFQPAKSTKTHIREFHLGKDRVNELVGNSMHVFLLNIPKIKFAAIVPKGEHATLCILGEDIDSELVDRLMATPQVKSCLPDDVEAKGSCRCSPAINVGAAPIPFRDRMVFIGDCGASRLYKDGIGAAYRTSKAAANTALLHGVAKTNFEKGFKAACDRLEGDNKIGKFVFAFNHYLQEASPTRKGVMKMVAKEQRNHDRKQHMSPVLWDTFTGSGSYKSILMRSMNPMFLANLLGSTLLPGKGQQTTTRKD